MRKEWILIILLIIALIYYNIPKKVIDIKSEISGISSILSSAEKSNNGIHNISSTELNNLYTYLDNITKSIDELNRFKRISKDEELYSALKTIIQLEIISAVLDNDEMVEAKEKTINRLVEIRTKPLISLIKADVDIRKYIKEYKNKNYDSDIIVGTKALSLVGSAASLRLKSTTKDEEKLIIRNFRDNFNDTLWLHYLYNMQEKKEKYDLVAKIYLPYLKEKNIYNENIESLMQDIMSYTLNYSFDFILNSPAYTKLYVTDNNYMTDFLIEINNYSISDIAEERKQLIPLVCNHYEYLLKQGKKECEHYLKVVGIKKLINNLKDNNTAGNTSYIMIDDELCFIQSGENIDYFSKNQFCKAIKERYK